MVEMINFGSINLTVVTVDCSRFMRTINVFSCWFVHIFLLAFLLLHWFPCMNRLWDCDYAFWRPEFVFCQDFLDIQIKPNHKEHFHNCILLYRNEMWKATLSWHPFLLMFLTIYFIVLSWSESFRTSKRLGLKQNVPCLRTSKVEIKPKQQSVQWALLGYNESNKSTVPSFVLAFELINLCVRWFPEHNSQSLRYSRCKQSG